MKKIAIVGYKGKMGYPIFLSLQKKFDVVGIGRGDSLEAYDDIDLVIDVASGSSSVVSAEYCFKKKIPIIIASTGQTPPVTMSLDHGIGAIRPFTRFGPRTSPGNTLQRSHPTSCAAPTSDTLPHPGV